MLPFFFYVTIVFGWVRFVVAHTQIHQATFTLEGSNVHTPVYFYIEKNSKCPLFWYTYIRKNPFELSNIRTPEHPYTKFCAQIPCSNSVLRFSNSVLSLTKLSCAIFSLHFSPSLYYPLCTAHWWGLSVHFSRTGGDYLSIFHALVGIIYPFFSYGWGLSIHFSRMGGDYLLFIYSPYIIHYRLTYIM